MRKDQAKVISFVPSWTETLIESKVNVVGRTRFCIHPEIPVSKLPAVGGTKNHDIKKIIELKPDFVVVDKEENKRELADELALAGIKTLVSHVDSISSAVSFLRMSSEILENQKLSNLADRYESILCAKDKLSTDVFWKELILDQDKQYSFEKIKSTRLSYLYLIWNSPFMSVAQGTFIWNLFELFGIELAMPEGHIIRPEIAADKYPQITEEKLIQYFCLLSSEPFPFENQIESIRNKGISCALIDGEKTSWYGIRNLKFLESCMKQ
jgi:hypothetical protein